MDNDELYDQVQRISDKMIEQGEAIARLTLRQKNMRIEIDILGKYVNATNRLLDAVVKIVKEWRP